MSPNLPDRFRRRDDRSQDPTAGDPGALIDLGREALGGLAKGWGRERLLQVASAEQIAQIGFDKAPAVFRSDRLPAEVRDGFADLWDAIAAEVVDFVALNGEATLRTKAGRNSLWVRLRRVLAQGQMVTIAMGHTYPLPLGPWGHRAVGVAGAGGLAFGEQFIAGASLLSGPTAPIIVAVVGAAMTELFEVYVAASARQERYRHAARRPSLETIATDLGALYGASGLGSRPTDRRMAEQAMRAMLTRVVRRAQWRFSETLVPAIGPVISGTMTGGIVTKAQRPALRAPDPTEQGAPD